MRVDAKNQVSKHLRVRNSPLLAYALEVVGQHGEAEFHSFPCFAARRDVLAEGLEGADFSCFSVAEPSWPVAGEKNSVYTIRIYIRDGG